MSRADWGINNHPAVFWGSRSTIVPTSDAKYLALLPTGRYVPCCWSKAISNNPLRLSNIFRKPALVVLPRLPRPTNSSELKNTQVIKFNYKKYYNNLSYRFQSPIQIRSHCLGIGLVAANHRRRGGHFRQAPRQNSPLRALEPRLPSVNYNIQVEKHIRKFVLTFFYKILELM